MFKNIKDKKIFEKIVDQVKDAVLSGELKAGDKLPSENELAHIFGISRATVREAFRTLELSGLIIIKQGSKGGAFIQKVESNKKLKEYFSDHLRFGNINFKQLMEARYWIESIIIDIVGQKGSKKDFENIRKSINNAEGLFRQGKEVEKIYENFYFHILLAEITKNPILIDTIATILELVYYIMNKAKPTGKITLETIEAHKEILKLLELGYPEKAKEVNKIHIKKHGDLLIKEYLIKENITKTIEFPSLNQLDAN